MTQQLATTQNTDADIAALATEARELDDDFRVGYDLKFVKGVWHRRAGDTKIEISSTAPFIADMLSYRRGWICWRDGGKPLKLMGRIVDGFISPVRDRLGDLKESEWPRDKKGVARDPWQENFALVLRDTTADELCTWTTTSWFGQKALGALLSAYVGDYNNHPGCMPVVLLSSENKSTTSYGDVAAPVFKIVDWKPFGEGASPPGSPLLAPAALPVQQELLPPAKRQALRVDMDDEIPF